MKVARSLTGALSLLPLLSLGGCGSNRSACPGGFEEYMSMCVPIGEAPDAAMVGADAPVAPGQDGGTPPLTEDGGTLDASVAPLPDAAAEVAPDAAVPPDTGCRFPALYIDSDGDGFGDAAEEMGPCLERLEGYVRDTGDCDDSRAHAHPGASEACDGADDDCDGTVDEGVTSTFYGDGDGDGYGGTTTIAACSAPAGYVTESGDCNDANPRVAPGGKRETCDGIDNDCNGLIDEGWLITFYMDVDRDGHGRADTTTQACTVPVGYAAAGDDCDDAVGTIHPGAPESCNLRDDDCDLATDEGVTTTYYVDADGDGWGRSDRTAQACSMPAGHAARGGDCDDAYAGSSPAGVETCDLRDNDCDGMTDELVRTTFFRDADGDGFGRADVSMEACTVPSGYASASSDCNDGSAAIHPGAAETCNDVDDDCNGLADEGLARVSYFVDCDRDGEAGTSGETLVMCRPPTVAPTTCSGGVWRAGASTVTDCHDTNASVFSGQTASFAGPIPGRIGELAYDYDCSGASDRIYTQTALCSGVPRVSGWASAGIPGCGAIDDWLTCTSGGGGTLSSVQQRCR